MNKKLLPVLEKVLKGKSGEKLTDKIILEIIDEFEQKANEKNPDYFKNHSKYKGVTKLPQQKGMWHKTHFWLWQLTFQKKKHQGTAETEVAAALAYDRQRIKLGLEPVNILKAK